MGDSLPIPADQRHLPRAERQFPYRWLNAVEREEVRREGGEAITGVHRFIHKVILRYAPPGLTREDHDDIVAEVCLRLWRDALPRFDAYRKPKVKLSTFLMSCVYRAAYDIIRRHRRANHPAHLDDAIDVPGPDQFHDRHIEALADSLLSDPTPLGRHAAAILNKPREQSDADLATILSLGRQGVPHVRHEARRKAVAILHAA